MTKDKILSLQRAKKLAEQWRQEGKQIVFTNGCFDILHLGHIDYLEKARLLGDKMIVALNTDQSVQRLKGPKRPVNKEEARGRVMAALGFVDIVVYFDEDTPFNTIKELKPDILVKGSDYLAENIVGADIVVANGGRVETLDLIQGYSTTGLIEKIKKT